MPGFLYFIATDKCAVTAEEIGLGALFPKGITCKRVEREAPGVSGVLAHGIDVDIPPERFIIDEENQTWITRGEVSVGLWNDWKPTEESLFRNDDALGSYIPLGNDETWLMPRILNRDGKLALPFWLVTERLSLSAQFGQLQLQAQNLQRFVHAVNGDRERRVAPMDDNQVVELFASALSLNYRLSLSEVLLLGLFQTSDHFAVAIETLIGA